MPPSVSFGPAAPPPPPPFPPPCAVIFHYSVPVLSHEVADRSRLKGIFATAFAAAAVVYLVLGTVGAMYFREQVTAASPFPLPLRGCAEAPGCVVWEHGSV